MISIPTQATVGAYVDDLVGAMRLDRDIQSVHRANDGLTNVNEAVKERGAKYQSLIKGGFLIFPLKHTKTLLIRVYPLGP